MTSKEISKLMATDLSTNGWLRELAYQMALRNERDSAEEVDSPLSVVPPKRGPGRPKKVA